MVKIPTGVMRPTSKFIGVCMFGVGFIYDHLIGPYFFDENFGGNKYLGFLKMIYQCYWKIFHLKQCLNLI